MKNILKSLKNVTKILGNEGLLKQRLILIFGWILIQSRKCWQKYSKSKQNIEMQWINYFKGKRTITRCLMNTFLNWYNLMEHLPSAGLLYEFWPRQKVLKIFICMIPVSHVSQQILQVKVYIKSVCLGSFNQAVDCNWCSCSFRGVCKQPVLSTCHEWSYGIFGSTIWKWASSVKKIVLHKRLLVLCISNSFRKLAASKSVHRFKPRPKDLENRFFTVKTLGCIYLQDLSPWVHLQLWKACCSMLLRFQPEKARCPPLFPVVWLPQTFVWVVPSTHIG